MIRLLENEETKDIKLYDVVDYAGHEWYVIGLNGNEVTLLVKDKVFRGRIFDKDSNDYKTSVVRDYINSDILPKLLGKGANPIPTNLPDVGCTDKVWLLSLEEAKNLPVEIRKFPSRWWLRSQGRYDYCAAFVNDRGDKGVRILGSVIDYDRYAVRPAMRVKLEDLLS